MYATKRRRRNVKPIKSPVKDPPKSNPSKRHRERLNSELDHLASLLPFEQSVISKLDKLSILRLAVSYLRTKSYFQSAIHERYSQENQLLHRLHHRIHHGNQIYSDVGLVDSESVLQALNGFLFIVTCDGEVFFASHTVEQYLGFHQSDIIHQSVMELIHSEDREQFKMQLNWRSSLPQESADLTVDQALSQDNCHLLRRCFTARFRCLLDNTSGFITLEISGKIRVLHGQSLKGDGSPLALFALCSPFGPLPLNDVASRDMHTFKSKHKMDMSPISMDPRGKMFFGYTDRELLEKGGYDLVHTDDLTYFAAAHQELIKTGSSGLIAYRLLTKDFNWIWLQTSSKVIYKNSKPDFVICTHRQLTDDEGRDLARKRGSEFKLPYAIIDVDPSVSSTLDELSSTYPVVHCGSTASSMTSPPTAASEIMSTVGTLAQQVTQQQLPPPPTTVAAKSKTRANRKSSSGTSASGNGAANAGSNKNQLRDYLQAGRKRKAPSYHDLYAAATAGLVSPYHVVAAAAAVAAVGAGAPAGYGPVPHGGNPINGSCYPTSGYPVSSELKQELAYNSTHSSASSAYINAADDPYRAASFGYHQAALYADSFQFDDRTPSIVGSYYGGSSLSNGYYYYPPTPGTTCVDQYAAAAAAAASGFPQYANYMADFHTNSASATTAAAASAGTGSGTGIGPASGSSSNGSMTSPSRYGRTSRTSGYYNGGLDLTARAVAFQQYAGAAASSDQRDVISLFDPSDVGSRRRYASGRTGATDCAAANAGLFNPLLTSGYLYGSGSDSDVTASLSGRNVRGGIGEDSSLVAQHMQQQQHAELTAGMCDSQSNRFATTGYCVAGNVQYSSSPNEHHQQQQVVGATIADCTVIRRTTVADDQGSPRRTPPNWQQQQQIDCDINSSRAPAVKPSTRPHDDVTSTSSLQNTLPDAATVRSTNPASSCIGMATSVIQLPGRRRTYDKEQTASNSASGNLVGTSGSAISSGGGVAVPVVKSTPSAAVAAWIQSAAAAAAASDTSTSYWTNSYGVSQPRAALHDNSISSPAKVVCYGESCW